VKGATDRAAHYRTQLCHETAASTATTFTRFSVKLPRTEDGQVTQVVS